MDWITAAIENLKANELRSMEPSADLEESWIQHHDEIANMTLVMQTNSWYTGANIEGKQKRLLSYIGGVGTYRQLCDELTNAAYPGFNFT